MKLVRSHLLPSGFNQGDDQPLGIEHLLRQESEADPGGIMYRFFIRLAVVAGIPATVPVFAQSAATTPAWTKEDYETSAAVVARAQQLLAAPQERGCLGKDAVTCVATIALSTRISSTPPHPGATGVLRFPKKLERDIYGKPVYQSVSFLTLVTPAGKTQVDELSVLTDLMLADGEHVNDIDFDLPRSPVSAKTEADWDATAVFEIATAVMGRDCIGTDRLAFYRLFDKAQNSGEYATTMSDDLANPGVSKGSVGTVALCGASMTVTFVSGVSINGRYGGSTVHFGMHPRSMK